MLGCSEDGLAWLVEDLLGDRIPFAGLDFLGGPNEKRIFFDGPGHPFFTFQQIQILEVQKLWLFPEEDEGEVIPKFGALNI